MKSKYPNASPHGPIKALSVRTLVGLSLVGGLSLASGCAHQQPQQSKVQEQQQQTVAELKSRLEEVERTNGRLNVRIEELEDQIFLLQDMTESNRIALRRRGLMQRGGFLNPSARAQAPQPTPESYYGSASPYGAQPGAERAQPKRRNVTRIPLSRGQSGAVAPRAPAARQDAPAPESQAAEEVVITDEEYRQFAGVSPRESKSRQTSKSSGRKAQPPVTDEKLSTSDADKKEGAQDDGAERSPAKSSPNVDKPLDLYKVALSDYRQGNYSDALSGFRAFLNAGPNANYLDNALYWVGECHYGMGEYEEAVSFFQRVLREQPDGNKVPDAMLKMSLAFERLGDVDQSSALLEKLTNRYPTTNAGRLGAQKLSELQN